MKAHHLSMSRTALAKICSWSFRADAPQSPRPSGAPARIGTHVHKLIEVYVKQGVVLDVLPGDPAEVAEAKALFSKPLRAYLDSVKWTACEIGLRYNARTDTTKLGPRRGEPGYEDVSADELPGTLDLVHVDGDEAMVLDAKSGKLVTDREQLYAQAVAVSRLYGVSTVKVGYLYARKTKCDAPELETLDADALDMHAGALSKVVRRLPIAAPVAGDHCWRCDSKPACPAYGALAAGDSERELEAAGFFS